MSFQGFLGGARPSPGVELELQLVHARSMAQAWAIDKIPAGVPAEFLDAIKPVPAPELRDSDGLGATGLDA